MPEFIATLPEAEVAWGAFKVVGVDDRGLLKIFFIVPYLPLFLTIITIYKQETQYLVAPNTFSLNGCQLKELLLLNVPR